MAYCFSVLSFSSCLFVILSLCHFLFILSFILPFILPFLSSLSSLLLFFTSSLLHFFSSSLLLFSSFSFLIRWILWDGSETIRTIVLRGKLCMCTEYEYVLGEKLPIITTMNEPVGRTGHVTRLDLGFVDVQGVMPCSYRSCRGGTSAWLPWRRFPFWTVRRPRYFRTLRLSQRQYKRLSGEGRTETGNLQCTEYS